MVSVKASNYECDLMTPMLLLSVIAATNSD